MGIVPRWLSNFAIIGIPLVGGLAAYLYPTLELAGVFRTAGELNNGECIRIDALQACEDAWVHHDSGLAYLPCSDPDTRQNWLPAMLRLNATALPAYSTDYIAILDLTTLTHRKLSLVNTPPSFPGLYLHALEIYPDPVDPSSFTVFVNSHRPPANREYAHETGAESVIEIFETRLGEGELRWIKTVRDQGDGLIWTPNNIVAVGKRQFYLTNDHKRKTAWWRHLEALHSEPSNIVYCDATDRVPKCSVAVADITYPNGIVKGFGQQLYSVSSLAGGVNVWDRQADNSLILIDHIPLPRPADNVHTRPDGAIFVSAFPKILEFVDANSPAGYAKGATAAVEAWKVSKEEGEDQFYGKSHKVEIVFADTGKIVSGTTSAAPYKNKVVMTGVATQYLAVCTLPDGV